MDIVRPYVLDPMSETITLGRREVPSSRPFALFAKGFRPFFVLAALHAALIVPAWILVHGGTIEVRSHLLPSVWHAHEMIFGFVVAVIAGFLLTAASNWTSRPTATGGWLVALCLVWIAGRAAPWLGGIVPDEALAAVSLAFLPLLALVLARVLLAATNRRNYPIVGIVIALFAAQLTTHVAAFEGAFLWQMAGPTIAVDLVIVLIVVIGGRIIPLFTRNATQAEGIRGVPALDVMAVLGAVAITVADVAMIRGVPFAAIAFVAAIATLARMRRWGTAHTAREPMLWVLHVGYLFVPLGFAVRSVAALSPHVAPSTALHVLTVGAIGTLTLGMMARVSLGHTGRPLKAPRAITVAFVCVVLATLARVVGPIVGGAAATASMHSAGTLFALAFLLFLVRIGPSLFRPRPDGRPG